MSEATNLRLAIGLLAYGGQITSFQAMMWLELGAMLRGSSSRFTLVGFQQWDINPVDRARNFALATAMRLGADWLLMLDADTFVQVSADDEDAGFQLLRMISDADRNNAAIVVAPVMARATQPYAYSKVNGTHLMAYRLGEGGIMEDITLENERRGLVPIDSAATAVMAINLHEADRAKAVFRFVEPSADARGLSEDHAFCKQIREVGGKIFCDTRVRTGHMSKSFPLYNDATDDAEDDDEGVVEKTPGPLPSSNN